MLSGHAHFPSQRPSLPGCLVSAGDSVKNTEKYIPAKRKATEQNNEGSQAGGSVEMVGLGRNAWPLPRAPWHPPKEALRESYQRFQFLTEL